MSENSALLGAYNTPQKGRVRKHFSIERAVGFLLVLLLLVALFRSHKDGDHVPVNSGTKKNVIFMVTDGMGPASLSLARSFRQHRDGLSIDDILTLDKHLVGSSRTRSNDSLVTDSAAGATAFSCGLKSYNGAIGVSPEKTPCGTILEALKLQGYLTGLVVTTRITDATPAAFSSHVDMRSQEDQIAEQQLGENPLGRVVDLIIGGGRCHFLPATLGGCRSDSRNLVEEAQRNNWTYAGDRASFDLLDEGRNVSLPLLSLLANTDIPYDIDRDEKVYPSLAEQVKVALTALEHATKDSDKGFFLLIEGSRIDHAGHHNDPAAQVREVLAYDAAFEQVIEFIDASDVETVAISTSDHETGGLATARQILPDYPEYLWFPQVLADSKHSGEYVARKLVGLRREAEDDKKFDQLIVETVEKDLGIKEHTKAEVQAIKNAVISNPGNVVYVVNDMISVRSETGWTTHGHSAVDVNIYAYSNSKSINQQLYSHKPFHGLLGNHENIEIGAFMESITGADLSKVTEQIQDTEHGPRAVVKDTVELLHADVVPGTHGPHGAL